MKEKQAMHTLGKNKKMSKQAIKIKINKLKANKRSWWGKINFKHTKHTNI